MASTFTVERSSVIAAPAEVIWAHLVDFHRWPGWSPWEDLDPQMQRTYTGAPSGVGAAYAWSGNKKAGRGRMEITAAAPAERLDIDLDFEKPFSSSNKIAFLLDERPGGTEVRWQMTGPRPLVMRLMSPVLNMDKLVGADFEKGLARLRTVTGSDPA